MDEYMNMNIYVYITFHSFHLALKSFQGWQVPNCMAWRRVAPPANHLQPRLVRGTVLTSLMVFSYLSLALPRYWVAQSLPCTSPPAASAVAAPANQRWSAAPKRVLFFPADLAGRPKGPSITQAVICLVFFSRSHCSL